MGMAVAMRIFVPPQTRTGRPSGRTAQRRGPPVTSPAVRSAQSRSRPPHASAGERHVRGDHDVSRTDPSGDPVIGGIEARRNDHSLNQRPLRHTEKAVGDDMDLELVTRDDPIRLVLYRAGRSVDIDANVGSSSTNSGQMPAILAIPG
jgi:hypothetical protein